MPLEIFVYFQYGLYGKHMRGRTHVNPSASWRPVDVACWLPLELQKLLR